MAVVLALVLFSGAGSVAFAGNPFDEATSAVRGLGFSLVGIASTFLGVFALVAACVAAFKAYEGDDDAARRFLCVFIGLAIGMIVLEVLSKNFGYE